MEYITVKRIYYTFSKFKLAYMDWISTDCRDRETLKQVPSDIEIYIENYFVGMQAIPQRVGYGEYNNSVAVHYYHCCAVKCNFAGI